MPQRSKPDTALKTPEQETNISLLLYGAEGIFLPNSTIENAYRFEADPQTGRLALANPNNTLSRERRLRYDLSTQFAEIVDGSMRTEFELKYSGQDLIGEDGSSMDEITQKSLSIGQKMAEAHPFFEFEARRRRHEREEFGELLQMADGKGPNAMIVVSDFPAELYGQPEDVGGYNVKRKQTMLRVMTRKADGSLRMYSQSLDRSDRQALEKIYAYFGQKPEEGELLGQRIRAHVAEGEEDQVADNLTKVYDQSLTNRLGGNWYAGRQPIDYRNTYEFVVRQNDLINHCIEMDKRGTLDNQYMYDIAATMQDRFDKELKDGAISTFTRPDIASLRYEVMQAGFDARLEGRAFSGCGLTFKANNLMTGGLKNILNLSGFSNSVTENCTFISQSCPQCGESNVKTTVTSDGKTRHISGACGCSVNVPVEN